MRHDKRRNNEHKLGAKDQLYQQQNNEESQMAESYVLATHIERKLAVGAAVNVGNQLATVVFQRLGRGLSRRCGPSLILFHSGRTLACSTRALLLCLCLAALATASSAFAWTRGCGSTLMRASATGRQSE